MCVCACVRACVCVRVWSGTAGYEATYERYQWIQNYKVGSYKKAIVLKWLRSRDMAWKKREPTCGLLFPRTTILCSMAGYNQEVPSPAFYSGGASPRCGVWWIDRLLYTTQFGLESLWLRTLRYCDYACLVYKIYMTSLPVWLCNYGRGQDNCPVNSHSQRSYRTSFLNILHTAYCMDQSK